MKTAFNLFALSLTALLLAQPPGVNAQFVFTTNTDGSLNVKQYTGSGGAAVIPSTTNGLRVTTIGVNAFLNCYSLTSVTLGTNLATIGDYSFYNCTNLAGVTIPNSVTNIGGWAFLSCGSLTSVTIGTNVASLGKSAFAGCGQLGGVVIPNSVTSLGDYAFSGCKRLTNLTIGAKVTGIPDYAFSSCAGLTWVTIPNGVTNIGYSAFGSCSGLTNLALGTNLMAVGTNAFSNCNGLREVLLPNSVSTVADHAFAVCEALTNLSLGRVLNLGPAAFYYCTSLPSVTIPPSLTNIGIGAFDSCDSLVAITVNSINPAYSSVAGVLFNKSQTALVECPGGARSCTIPNGVMKIQDWAFAHCYSLRSVTIPSSVTSIGNSAFSSSPNLTTVYCSGNAPSLGSEVFYGDSYATVYYLAGRTGWSATFGGCPAVMLDPSAGSLLVTVSPVAVIPAGAWWQVDGGVAQPSGGVVTGVSAGEHTVTFNPVNGWATPVSQSVAVSANSITNLFGAYGQLTYRTNNGAITITGTGPSGPGSAVVFPGMINSRPVTSIGDYAFFGQTSLTSLTIPASVTNIGVEAFVWCSRLGTILVDPANLFFSSANGVLFNKDQTILVQFPGGVSGSYTIPQGVTRIGDYAFELCALNSITIPNSVTNIGNAAFYESSSLASVTVGGNVISIGDWAFHSCASLASISFLGNAPGLGSAVFDADSSATVYHLPWTTGWGEPGAAFGGCPTVLWLPQVQTGDGSFGARTNRFGFNITWAPGTAVVVEACTNLAEPDWIPVETNTLTGGAAYFSDSDWTNYSGRFYRLRWP
jgi:hypothetical protein